MTKVVYKYMKFEIGKFFLENRRLKATPPNDFNDPFEFNPESYTRIDEDQIFDFLRKKALTKKYYHKIIGEKNENVTLNQYYRFIIENDHNLKEVVREIVDSLKKRNFAPMVNDMSKSYGVLCFSQGISNILLWSHYAENHTGLSIGFDRSKLSQKWFKVDYDKKRVRIPFGSFWFDMDYQKSIEKLIKTKSKIWEYENEHRIVIKINECIKDTIQGKTMYFKPIQENAIIEIVLGARMSQENKSKIRALITNKNIRVREAQLDLRQYKINIS